MGDEDAPEWVIQTQQTLGELIKRPKLTSALLQKPPMAAAATLAATHSSLAEVRQLTS